MLIRAASKEEKRKVQRLGEIAKKVERAMMGRTGWGQVRKQCNTVPLWWDSQLNLVGGFRSQAGSCPAPVGSARAGGLRFSAALPLEKRHPRPLWGTLGMLRAGACLSSRTVAYCLREGRPARKKRQQRLDQVPRLKKGCDNDKIVNVKIIKINWALFPP